MAANKDSATYGLVVLVVGAILVPCLSAPLHTDEPALSAAWWYNACSHRTRHNDISKLQAAPNCKDNLKHVRLPVKGQIKHFKNSYKKEVEYIRKLYQPHIPMTCMGNKSLLLFSWLPKRERPKQDRTLGQALVKFHEDLQRYAVAIHKLERLEVHTNIQFDLPGRKQALGRITDQLRLLLCEIETAVNLTCQPLPQRVPPTFPDDPATDDITKQSDLTVLIAQDCSVLSRLDNFLRSSQRSFKKLLNSGNERLVDEDDDAASDSSAADGSGER